MYKLTHNVERLPSTIPFVGPEAQERLRGSSFGVRIGANESVFGPSPSAIEAMKVAARDVWKYGDPENYDLRMALAQHLDVEIENVVVGEGIDGLLGYLVRMVTEEGVNVVTSLGAYPTFSFHVSANGGNLNTVPYRDDYEDLVGLIEAAIQHNASLIYLANPDNPMGTYYGATAISKMIESVPERCLLVLDEAYIECAPSNTAMAIDTNDKRIIRMRTFSKVYGMAGARVGYAIGHQDLIASFEKVRNHFGMCRISQAGALAALQDQDYISKIVSKIMHSRCRIEEIAKQNGLNTIKSSANFVAIDCGRDGAFAFKVMVALIDQGVFVRMPLVAPQDRCIRVTVGKEEDLQKLEYFLPIALNSASQ